MNNYYPFVNLPLPYDYDALEPFIDTLTMHLHHDGHLQTYIDNLNRILKENPYLQKMSLEELIKNESRLPNSVRDGVRNNAGGVYNHRLYFSLLKNLSEELPMGAFANAIIKEFGSVEAFLKKFKEAALSVFGSGYAWLVFIQGRIKIITTPNQNCPLESGYKPIITVDVWEHAYYLKHYNMRGDYLMDWQKIINWRAAEQLYNKYSNTK